MDALFGPATCPTATGVLDALGTRMRVLVGRVLAGAGARGITPREAALAISERSVPPGKPYGRWQSSESALPRVLAAG